MTAKLIAAAVVAALLLSGGGPPAAQTPGKNTAATPTEAQTAAILTAEEAQAAALSHAGLTAADVTQLRSHYDADERIPEWEVEFRSGDWEYDYTIHTITGDIMTCERDYEPVKTAPPATQPPAEQPAARLTAQEAEAAALTHAGLTAADVTQLRSHYDADDPTPDWDVEFRSGDWEYDYSVDPATGAILSWERDYEPVKAAPPATEPPAPQKTQYLTEQKVKELVLAHAGLTEDQVTRLRIEFDWDDGRPEYEVDFLSGGMEYEYELHAETGKILSWDKERDD